MIYLDTSAIVKLVAAEQESASLIDWLNARREESLVTSVIGHIELMRAIASTRPDALIRAGSVASTIDTLVLTGAVAATAATIPPAELHTLDAIHLATAYTHRAGLVAFCAYDRGLLEAAASQGLLTVSPGGDENVG